MDISHFYKVLSVIEKTNSITAAAEQLGYTQSGLSHTIQRFEQEHGFQLLIRGNSGVTLTQNAYMILPLAREIENNLEKIDEIIQLINNPSITKITVGTFASIAMHIMPEALKAFSKTYPNITVEIKKGSVSEIQNWIKNKDVDIAFTSHQQNDMFKYTTIIDERFYAVVSKDYKKKFFDLTEIEQYPFIMPSTRDSTNDHDIQRILDDYNLNPNIRFYSMDWISIPKMVEMGLGISILPKLIVNKCNDNVKILPIQQGCSRELVVAQESLNSHMEIIKVLIKNIASTMISVISNA